MSTGEIKEEYEMEKSQIQHLYNTDEKEQHTSNNTDGPGRI